MPDTSDNLIRRGGPENQKEVAVARLLQYVDWHERVRSCVRFYCLGAHRITCWDVLTPDLRRTARQKVLAELRQDYQLVFRRQQDAFFNFIHETEAECNLRDLNADEFCDFISHKLNEFTRSNLSAQEFEQGLRDLEIRTRNLTPLNQVICYGTYSDQAEEERPLHFIHFVILPAFTLTWPELFGALKDGCRKLAAELQSNPNLAQIEQILLTSWIFENKPRIMERLKRQGVVFPEESEPGSAYIKRDKFIQAFGRADSA
ncbi:MAG: hypothetical protein HY978_00085 [Candidatus Liptonbacteria bacterium]|nr:hypothetical protein [Candidatus Liptonbacteria bacterium]